MFNMGFTELIFLGAIALVFIGPKQLPEVARTIARLLNELKRTTSGITDSFKDIKSEADSMRHSAENALSKEIQSVKDGVLNPDENHQGKNKDPNHNEEHNQHHEHQALHDHTHDDDGPADAPAEHEHKTIKKSDGEES